MQGIGKLADLPSDIPREPDGLLFWNGKAIEPLAVRLPVLVAAQRLAIAFRPDVPRLVERGVDAAGGGRRC